MKSPVIAGGALLACLAALMACDARNDVETSTRNTTTSSVGGEMSSAIEKARRKLETGNITVSGDGADGKAEITPAGDLLIDGRQVPVTPQQRALLMEHRSRIVAVAGAGMDVGMQGAGLAVKAMGEAVRGVFTGDTDGIEQRVEAQADGIRRAAGELCDRMPALLESQRQLAAALPEFAPYATMSADDIADCRRDIDNETAQPSDPSVSPATEADR